MRRFLLPTFLTLTLFLTACTATSSPLPSDLRSAPVSTDFPAPEFDSATRTDQQGAITIEITPLNLDTPTNALEFDVLMDTHSIDLSMDLATLATLTTNTGVTVQATLWDAPRGGHHVSGKLIFPSIMDGKSIFEGATKLTLTILNVDVPLRVFEWELK